jgi:hypothetical protein
MATAVRDVSTRPAWQAFVAAAAAVAVLVAGSVVILRPPWERVDRPSVAGWLATTPSARAAIGPIALDGSMADAVQHLGAPDEVGPDLFGEARTWRFSDGAELTLTPPEGASEPVLGIVATVPFGATTRFGLFGGLRLGASSIADIVRAWGPPEATGGALDDFDVRYIECRGPFPIVLKIDHDPTFDRALIAYADEAPGSAGCGG